MRTTDNGLCKGRFIKVKRDGRRCATGTVVDIVTIPSAGDQLFVQYRADHNGGVYITKIENVSTARHRKGKTA